MLKPIAGIVVVVALAVGLPPVLGSMTEEQVRVQLKTMAADSVVSFEILSYERDWFGSRAIVNVGIRDAYLNTLLQAAGSKPTPPGNGAASPGLPVRVEIEHGPVLFRHGLALGFSRVRARLDPAAALVAELEQQLAMPYLVELSGQLQFTGRFDFAAQVPPISFAADGMDFSFSGIRIDGDARSGRIRINGELDALGLETPDGSARMDGLRFSSDGRYLQAYVWDGEASVDIERAHVLDGVGAGSTIMDLQSMNLSIESRTAANPALSDNRWVYTAEHLSMLADSITIDAMELGISLTDFPGAAVAKYAAAAGAADPANPFAAMALAQQTLAELFSGAPEFAVDPLRFSLGDGDFEARLSLRTSAAASQGRIDLASNPFALLNAIEVDLDARAHKSLVEQLMVSIMVGQSGGKPAADANDIALAKVQLTLATLLGQGYLVDADDSYQGEIRYRDSQLTVNGNVIPLASLFM